jgi:hypothetical protein
VGGKTSTFDRVPEIYPIPRLMTFSSPRPFAIIHPSPDSPDEPRFRPAIGPRGVGGGRRFLSWRLRRGEKRISVWVQKFKDRRMLVLQWIDPETGRRKSRSAGTDDPKKADGKRADLEYELNHGKYQEVSRMSWERFRELFEAEYLPHLRKNTRRNYRAAFDLFERLCNPRQLRSVTERTISAFAANMRTVEVPGRGKGMKASSSKVVLRQLRTALLWGAEQGFLPKCPKFPFVKLPKKKPQPIRTEPFERLLARAPDRQTQVYLLTGWLAGLHLSEAFDLE